MDRFGNMTFLHAGPFNMHFRQQLVHEKWLPDLIERAIPMSQGIMPLDLLTDDSTKARWANEGLPTDPLSIENGAIMTNASRWPLMIDPQLQVEAGWWLLQNPACRCMRERRLNLNACKQHGCGACSLTCSCSGDPAVGKLMLLLLQSCRLHIGMLGNTWPHTQTHTCTQHKRMHARTQGIKWVVNREEPLGLVIIQQSQHKYIDKVVYCIENGLPMLIENLPVDIDAVLDAVIGKQTIKKGKSVIMKIGDAEVSCLQCLAGLLLAVDECAGYCRGWVLNAEASCLCVYLLLYVLKSVMGWEFQLLRRGQLEHQCVSSRMPACSLEFGMHHHSAVEYDSKFRLYLQTKLSNPHYKPEIAAQTTLVNFCVTEK
eukprot:scaffold53212_cov17-Tisochrysis_lutea.AAC.1